MNKELQEEMKKNYDFFIKHTFKESDKGKFAIIRHQKIEKILDTVHDCDAVARDYKDGMYSIQKIDKSDRRIDLGILSDALHTI